MRALLQVVISGSCGGEKRRVAILDSRGRPQQSSLGRRGGGHGHGSQRVLLQNLGRRLLGRRSKQSELRWREPQVRALGCDLGSVLAGAPIRKLHSIVNVVSYPRGLQLGHVLS